MTRIAASDPRMWIDIPSANPGPVADLLSAVAADLDETVRALRALQSSDEAERSEGTAGIEDVLRRGNAGQVRVPGKHGSAPRVSETVVVLIDDQPGQLARIFADAGRAGVTSRTSGSSTRPGSRPVWCSSCGRAEGGGGPEGGAARAGLGAAPVTPGEAAAREPVTLSGGALAPRTPLPTLHQEGALPWKTAPPRPPSP